MCPCIYIFVCRCSTRQKQKEPSCLLVFQNGGLPRALSYQNNGWIYTNKPHICNFVSISIWTDTSTGSGRFCFITCHWSGYEKKILTLQNKPETLTLTSILTIVQPLIIFFLIIIIDELLHSIFFLQNVISLDSLTIVLATRAYWGHSTIMGDMKDLQIGGPWKAGTDTHTTVSVGSYEFYKSIFYPLSSTYCQCCHCFYICSVILSKIEI